MKGLTKGMFHGGTLVEGREATIYTLNLLISVSAPSGAKNSHFFSYEIDNFWQEKCLYCSFWSLNN